MYYNYYNFINNNWDKLNEIDCIYYTKIQTILKY